VAAGAGPKVSLGAPALWLQMRLVSLKVWKVRQRPFCECALSALYLYLPCCQALQWRVRWCLPARHLMSQHPGWQQLQCCLWLLLVSLICLSHPGQHCPEP
jgi:hypothetical protein